MTLPGYRPLAGDELLNPDDLVIWAGAQLFVNVHPGGNDTATGVQLTWSSTLIMPFFSFNGKFYFQMCIFVLDASPLFFNQLLMLIMLPYVDCCI